MYSDYNGTTNWKDWVNRNREERERAIKLIVGWLELESESNEKKNKMAIHLGGKSWALEGHCDNQFRDLKEKIGNISYNRNI